METITSKSNRWIKLALELKNRKFRDKKGMFIMEGVRATEDAANQNIRDVVCFITEECAKEERTRKIIDRGMNLHWLFLLVNDNLMNHISDTMHNQGILMIVKKPERNLESVNEMDGRYVLLDHIQDPGNLGTILRTAAASGAKGVILTEGCTDPYSDKAVRSSMGSILRIPVYEKVSTERIKNLKEKFNLPMIGTSLKNAKPYKETEPVERGIIVFGNEGNGMTEEIENLCDYSVYIPLAGGVESLNVTAAAAVILFYNA